MSIFLLLFNRIFVILAALNTINLVALDQFTVNKIESLLEDLPDEEREYLENFFRFVIAVSGFGYVIHGSKPMAIETFDQLATQRSVEGFNYMDHAHILGKYRLREGWRVWLKVQHQFPLRDFTLISYPIDEKFIEIALINHASFIKVATEHHEEFTEALGVNVGPSQILEGYITGKFFKTIRNHDGLFGMLLGYGHENAWAFFEGNQANLGYFGDPNPPTSENFILLPMFRADFHSKETKALLNTYFEERKIIENIYKNGNFFVLSLLKISRE